MIYYRSCVWEERNSQKDECLNHAPPFYGHHLEACETCSEDKCNYRLISESHGGSMQLNALLEILLISLMIVLNI